MNITRRQLLTGAGAITATGVAVYLVTTSGRRSDLETATGGDGLSTSMQARLQKLISAANGYSTRTTIASPPTYSLGTAYTGASTINGNPVTAPAHSLGDPAKMTPLAPIIQTTANPAGEFAFAYSTNSGSTEIRPNGKGAGGNGQRIAFRNTAAFTAFDIAITGFANLSFRVAINRDWVQASDYTAALDGEHYVKLTFDSPVPADSLIELIVQGDSWRMRGGNIDAGTIVVSAGEASPIMELWGDSYINGGYPGATAQNSSVGWVLADVLGTRGIMQGRGSQGYDALADGRTILGRMQIDVGYAVADPDLVYMSNSVNDFNKDVATVSANMATALQLLQTSYPNTPIAVIVGFDKVSNGFPTGALDTVHAAILAVKDARTFIVDGRGWTKIAGSDGVHPTPSERDDLVALIKADLLAQWAAAIL